MTIPDLVDQLLNEQPVASLAVLESGSPAVSLVPFVTLRDPLRFYSLLSSLSSHTQALQDDPRCGLLIHANPLPGDPHSHHAIVRLSVKARARWLSREAAEQLGVTAAYRQRFAIAEMLLGLGDFQFVEFTPQEGTLIRGFGAAFHLTGPNLEQATQLRGR
ncbi:MAG: pyridoxamine 5'-phosphate oxidase family protein [Thermostichales cyanobacterium SZTDM-1c_bins_54]